MIALVSESAHPSSTLRPPPVTLGHASGSHGARAAGSDEVRITVSPESLGELIARLEDEGLFDLPGRARAPTPFPSFAIEVRVTGEGKEHERLHFVALDGLRATSDADVFAACAGAIVRAAGLSR